MSETSYETIARWRHGDVRPDDDVDLAIATAVGTITLDLSIAVEPTKWGHLCDGSALAVTQYVLQRLRALPVEMRMAAMGMEPSEENWPVRSQPPLLWQQIESGGAAEREAVGPGGASTNAATEVATTSRPAPVSLVPGVDLTPMPCPYCDYVHQPTKSGFGYTMHIVQKHPEHTVQVPFQEALEEAMAEFDALQAHDLRWRKRHS